MKKRSLLVATVMLLIAAVVATGTTYAWFTSTTSADATVSMKVAQGQALEIKTGEGDWKSSLTNSDFGITSSMWSDFTYADGFKTKVLDSNSDVSGSQTGTPVSVSVKIRSTTSGDVTVALSSIDFEDANYTNTNVESYARVTLQKGENYTHLAKTATTYSKTDTAANVSPNYSTVQSTTVSLTAEGDYYTADVTFYFWLEGTALGNTDVDDAVSNLIASLTFTQTALTNTPTE